MAGSDWKALEMIGVAEGVSTKLSLELKDFGSKLKVAIQDT